MKSSQLDSAKERLTELEQQLMKRDETIALQKRMLKTVKEEHKEQFNVCGDCLLDRILVLIVNFVYLFLRLSSANIMHKRLS